MAIQPLCGLLKELTSSLVDELPKDESATVRPGSVFVSKNSLARRVSWDAHASTVIDITTKPVIDQVTIRLRQPWILTLVV